MFTSTNREAEARRVKEIVTRLPQGFGMIINDENLCKHYLYHLIVGNVGIFNDVPILHLHHGNLPLVSQDWEEDMIMSYYDNQCLCILTDGAFEFPPDWIQRGRRYGPIFSDHRLQFHCTRYRRQSYFKDERFTLDLLTASAVKGSPAPAQPYNFNYRIMRIQNPQYLYNYRGRGGRRARMEESGPLGEPPSPFLGPPSI